MSILRVKGPKWEDEELGAVGGRNHRDIRAATDHRSQLNRPVAKEPVSAPHFL
jgi:hypothetical protein